jgi:hypothetical protein
MAAQLAVENASGTEARKEKREVEVDEQHQPISA